MGGTLARSGWGTPASDGYPRPEMWYPQPGIGYSPVQGMGYPPARDEVPSHPGMGYPPPSRDGVLPCPGMGYPHPPG